ncbi:MAG: LPS O-antigen length regulator [Idiomarina sp.]|nr:LPS O-antigen length regulator [Idiomarina sp.]
MTGKESKKQSIKQDLGPNGSIGEIDFKAILDTLWLYKWLILGFTMIFAIGSVLYALSLPNIYKAEAKLIPTKEALSANSGLGGEIGGLANLAGMNIGSGQIDTASLALEILQSRKFIAEFVNRHNILPELMASKEWDMYTNELSIDSSIYDVEREEWVREVEFPRTPEPSFAEYVQAFRNIMSVERSGSTSIITITIRHRSPVIASEWVQLIITDINNEMREREVGEATRSLEYIERELENIRLASSERVFYDLMESQVQTIMMANARPEYVFRIIDPPVVEENRASPPRAMIAIVGTIFGGFFSLLCILLIRIFQSYGTGNREISNS